MKKLTCIRRAGVLVLICAILCAAVCCACIFTANGLMIPLDGEPGELTADRDDIVSWTVNGGTVELKPLTAGDVYLGVGDIVYMLVHVNGAGVISEELTGYFSGWRGVSAAVLAFFALSTLILTIETVRQLRTELYSYDSPLLIAVSLAMLSVTARQIYLAARGRSFSVMNMLSGSSMLFLLVILPALALFALMMTISNLSLLRHEGARLRNLLGGAIGFGLCAGIFLMFLLSDFSGSETMYRVHSAAMAVFAAVLTFTVCKMIGIFVCGLIAARHEPELDKDYILILGCMLSRKGTLTPLLRGRVDKALDFARRQAEKTGSMPILMPCGGQGKNELTSEAAAMKTYLLEKGVPEDRILCEDRSENTWENLRNAKAMMPENAKIAFSTTRYHVFRAGLWAHRNGVNADGMGSPTKWYYWPNAFMREYIALIAANKRVELFSVALFAAVSAFLAIVG